VFKLYMLRVSPVICHLALFETEALKNEGTLLAVHREEEKVHWAGGGDSQAGGVGHNSTKMHFGCLLWLRCFMPYGFSGIGYVSVWHPQMVQ